MNAADRRRRFDELVLPHLDAAYNLARWLSGSAVEADDVVQEACLRAFCFFDSFRGDQPRAWLLAIVRNTWFSAWRKRQQPGQGDSAGYDDAHHDGAPLPGWQDGHGDSPEQWLLRADDVRLLHLALERLPAAFREVLVLRELEDLPYRDIAAIADIPLGTVMSRLARARKLLAQAVLALRQEGMHATGARAGGNDGAASPRSTAPDTGRTATVTGNHGTSSRPAGETGHELQ
ncbi:RNA polymerase sigma factor [Cupriavidus basilensis]|uniref:RNA polymerase sigma factor n=1 Tax=Cupriavidus basilensis TaxID=68895 RepID=A0ABT6AL14_9BURK|nr:RNA polymerase sigma factor [Cupriavidus basilensis]MDF3833297.1 RNA polymerase sigma factor [Cupriavidus basilensis]